MDGEVVRRCWTTGVSMELLFVQAGLLMRLSQNLKSLTDRVTLRTGRPHLY
jgi:hypothetical protein